MSDVIETFRILFGPVVFFCAVLLLVATGISVRERLQSTSVMAEVTYVGERCALSCSDDSIFAEPYECETAGPYPELVTSGFCEVIPGRYFGASFDESTVFAEAKSNTALNLKVGNKIEFLMSKNGYLRQPSPLEIPFLVFASFAAIGLFGRIYVKVI